MSLPSLPETIDPNAAHVEYRVMQCRSCEAYGPPVDMSDKENPAHLWDLNHMQEFRRLGQKHDKFYAWTMTRNTSRIM